LNFPVKDIELYTSFYALFLLLTVTGIMFERFLIHFYESWGYKRLFFRNQGKISSMKKVLIYGGGLLCRIYVSQLFCGFRSKWKDIKIVGIIDDDKALRRLNVYGFEVLGSLDDLEDIFQENTFESIIVTCSELKEEKKQRLRDFCQKHDIELEQLVCRVDKFQTDIQQR
jgi:FlaA1/EpsC-like NDP-sugar epimerase